MLAMVKLSPRWTGETRNSWPQLEHKGHLYKRVERSWVQHSLSLGIHSDICLILSGPLATAPEAGISLVTVAGKSEATRRDPG